MAIFIFILLIVLGVAAMVSSTRWKLSKDLINDLDLAKFEVYEKKAVSASAKLKMGETLAIPINSTVLVNDQEMHLIPNKFNLLLFMTDFPFSFYKKGNKKFKIQRSEYTEVVFTSSKKNASTFGKVFEVTIKVQNEDEKTEMLRKIKKW